MTVEKDPSSIGALLVAMGAITSFQLRQAVKEQARLRDDAVLGKILVANGHCTAKQLEIAMLAQERIRGSKPGSDPAIAVANLAIDRSRRESVIVQRQRLIEKGERLAKKITGEDHIAITDDMIETAEDKPQ